MLYFLRRFTLEAVYDASIADSLPEHGAAVGRRDGRLCPARGARRRRIRTVLFGRRRTRLLGWKPRLLRAQLFGRRTRLLRWWQRLSRAELLRWWQLLQPRTRLLRWRQRLPRRRRIQHRPLLRGPRILLRRALLGSSVLWLRNRNPVRLGLLQQRRMRLLRRMG